MQNKLILLCSLLSGLWIAPRPAAAQCDIDAPNGFCGNTPVTFSIQNPDGNAGYAWDFDGDGTPDSTGTTTEHVFPPAVDDASYTVTAFQDGNACGTITVDVLAGPDASLGVDPSDGTLDADNFIRVCTKETEVMVGFFNTSTTIPINTTYEIDWGDGVVETFDNTTFTPNSLVEHTYTSQGYKTIALTVVAQNGCTARTEYQLYFGSNPSVGLTNPGNTTGLCVPATVTFPIAQTNDNPPDTEYSIFVNDTLIVTYSQGNLPNAFTYTFEESSCGITTPSGIYKNAFEVKIVASTPCGNSASIIAPIEVSAPPELMLEVTPPASACPGEPYTFTNNSVGLDVVNGPTTTQCLNQLNATWSISNPGDWTVVNGNIFNSDSLTVTFDVPGTYGIMLTVNSQNCGSYTIMDSITIEAPPQIGIGDVDVQLPPGGVCPPTEVDFATSLDGVTDYQWSVDPPTGWTFSNGADSTDSPSITFTEGGDYVVQLDVANSCASAGWTDTLSVNGPPAADLAPIPNRCETAVLNFDAGSVSVAENGEPVTSYSWSFPGANIGSSGDPFPVGIAYDQPGQYTVSLIVDNACGPDTAVQTFEVEAPITALTPDSLTVCGNEPPFQLSATPGGGSWTGSGVSAGGLFDPAQVVPGPALLTYTVGVGACADTTTTQVEVVPFPDSDAGPDQTVCASQDSLLLNPAPANGTWSALAGGQFDDGLFLPSASGPGDYAFAYAVTAGNGCTAVDTVAVQVNPLPVLSAPDTAYCNVAGAFELPQPSPQGGSWSGTGVVGQAFDPSLSPGEGIYPLTYTFTDSNTCTNAVDIQVEVLPPVIAHAGADDSLCISSPPLSLAPDPAGGNWSGPGLVLSQPISFDPAQAGEGDHLLIYSLGQGSCADTDSLWLTVVGNPSVEAGPDLSVCAADPPVALSGFSPQGGSWSGPGITDDQAALFVPDSAGLGLNTLVYTYAIPSLGCVATDTLQVQKNPLPAPAFDAPDEVCTRDTLLLIDQSGGAEQWRWRFGDGATSDQANPEHAYEADGQYTISLQVTNAFGCIDSIARPIAVVAPPEIAFAPDRDRGCAPLAVTFANNSSGENLTFEWDFGNGETSADAQPGTIVFTEGTRDTVYEVSLQVSNQCGMRRQVDTVQVLTVPFVNFGTDIDTSCSPMEGQFSNLSTGGTIDVLWDFGNGNTSAEYNPPSQIFTAFDAPQTYTITLQATNQCGTDSLSRDIFVNPADVTAFFNVPGLEGCTPFTVPFTNFATLGAQVWWDFGDGNTSTQANPVHTYKEPGTYKVVQYADNGCGIDTTATEITVLALPEIAFELPELGCLNAPVTFANTSEGAQGFVWDFGDGNTSTLNNPTHTYDSAGTYTVLLTGSSANTGCLDTFSMPLVIAPLPDADFTLSDTSGCPPLQVQFEASSQVAQFFSWDFGDGNSSAMSNPVHTFDRAGIFEVRLSARDANGCANDTTTAQVTVHPFPEAAFTPTPVEDCSLPAQVVMENESLGGEGFFWDFGDGNTSTLNAPVHLYADSGNYTIRLVLENEFGCRDSVARPLRIRAVPAADFAIANNEGCSPVEVTFTNLSDMADSYFWDFGDGNTSEAPNPTHTYMEEGDYTVRLIAGSRDACIDTFRLEDIVSVSGSPTAGFEATASTEVPFDGTFFFRNLSEGAVEYRWDFGDGNTSDEEHPAHQYAGNAIWEVYLRAIAINGCWDDTLLTIEPPIIKGLYVPTALSPENGVGEVRLFKPKGIGLQEYHMQVFTPYGELIWESTLLENGQPVEAWDGTLNGQVLPQDVYVWKCRAVFEDGTVWSGQEDRNGKMKNIGSVTLLR